MVTHRLTTNLAQGAKVTGGVQREELESGEAGDSRRKAKEVGGRRAGTWEEIRVVAGRATEGGTRGERGKGQGGYKEREHGGRTGKERETGRHWAESWQG